MESEVEVTDFGDGVVIQVTLDLLPGAILEEMP